MRKELNLSKKIYRHVGWNINIIRALIRRFLPKGVRIIRESIYVDLMRALGKTATSITIKEFPVYPNGEIAFYKYPFLQINNKKYFSQFYGNEFVTDVTVGKRAYVNYTSEILTGEICSGETDLHVWSKSVLPISMVNKKTDACKASIDIIINDSERHRLSGLKQNSFHYLPVSAETDLTITSKNDYILGEPIPTEQKEINTKKKLVLSIFIDGLASKVFENVAFEKLMPNTCKYFSNGSLFFNGYANGNWTLPSVGSLFSGRYPINICW